MRPLLTLAFLFSVLTGFSNPVYQKLCDVNKLWLEQKDIDQSNLATLKARTETEWIQLHLSLVEKTLRQQNTAHLSATQVKNRAAALNELHDYWQAGRFPQNEEYSYRLPIFIDKYDNFCAVGYLVKATGYEQVSRMISAQTNLAYVREMKYPELFAWANEYGFTVDELAWVQPTYGPTGQTKPICRGTDGIVNELFVDNAGQRLYVGGQFSNVDSTITANNIAYITESAGTYTWHNMGTGVNGPVHAVATFNNKVFVAGSFSSAGGTNANNVAYWNGTTWNAAGCISGTVKSLIVYKGELYAAGDFDLCAGMSEVNFAKWTGTGWQQIIGLTGRVNTMEIVDSMLFLGGTFGYNNINQTNAIKWNPNTGFQTFSNVTTNEVNDFQVYKDTVHAICKYTSTIDSFIFRRLHGNTWDSISGYATLNSHTTLSLNTLCVSGDEFMVGGDFYRVPTMMGYHIKNSYRITPWYYKKQPSYPDDYFITDSAVNKMVVFNNRLIIGGAFKQDYLLNRLGGIAFFQSSYVPAPPPQVNAKTVGYKSCQQYNNGGATVNVTSGTPPYKYLWSTGDTTKTVSNLAPGNYSVVVTDSFNKTVTVPVNITATTVDTSVIVSNTPNGIILSAKTTGFQYSWLDCKNNILISAQNLKDFKPAVTGGYALVVTFNGCSDTSACYEVEVKETRIKEPTQSKVKIYPNPFNEKLHVDFGQVLSFAAVNITDVTGRLVITRSVSQSSHISIDMKELVAGLYTLSMIDNTGKTEYYKLVKN